MKIIITNISSDYKTITLDNGRMFIVEPSDTQIVKNWLIGTSVKIFTLDSGVVYNYDITNLERNEKIKAGISAK